MVSFVVVASSSLSGAVGVKCSCSDDKFAAASEMLHDAGVGTRAEPQDEGHIFECLQAIGVNTALGLRLRWRD